MNNNLFIEYRKRAFLTAYPSKVAHLASAFSAMELIYSLYREGILHIDINNPEDKNRDRFILSKGHASLALYVALNDIGLLSDEQLASFCKPGKSIGGEINPNDSDGIETATGSLGHGFGFGVGQAIALKLDHSPAHVYIMVGNGELNEGVIWESVMSAYKFKLDNLTVILDDNHIQKMGFTSETMRIDSWKEKWLAFGWDVDEIQDGHDVCEITRIISKQNHIDTPRVVIANTIKGKGVSIMENNPDWHFKMPYKRELKVFMNELGITEEELKNAESISNGII